MNAEAQARQWLDLEHPEPEEIKHSIDNLCHQLAGCRSKEGQDDLRRAIRLLMSQFGEAPQVSLPEAPAVARLDYGVLHPVTEQPAVPMTVEERRERFKTLREDLDRPF